MSNLTEEDERVLRQMIDREKTISTVWGWFRNIILVLAGGLITLWTAFDLMWPKK